MFVVLDSLLRLKEEAWVTEWVAKCVNQSPRTRLRQWRGWSDSITQACRASGYRWLHGKALEEFEYDVLEIEMDRQKCQV